MYKALSALQALAPCHCQPVCEVADHYEAQSGGTANVRQGPHVTPGCLTLAPLL